MITGAENSKKALETMELFKSGYSSSQSVAGAWCSEINLSFDEAVTVSAGFGWKNGCSEKTGALAGAVMVIGSIFSSGGTDSASRQSLYEIIKEYEKRLDSELTGNEPDECITAGIASAVLENFIREYERNIFRRERKINIRIVTFGNFDIFVDGISVRFRRSKSREALAYLVDRRTSCSKKQIAAVLFEDRLYDRGCQKYVDNILRGMISDLEAAGAGQLIKHRSNSYSVNPSVCDCDYYEYLDGNHKIHLIDEYMSQYSWSEDTLAALR